MANLRRINTSVEDSLYQRLLAIKEKYGFKNVCELNVAMLNILVDHVEEADGRQMPADCVDVYEEIDMMFNELENWEKVPNGEVPKRGHRPKDM